MSPIVRIESGALRIDSGRMVVPGPLILSNLVGHWDFSDITTLFTDTGRTVAVTSDGDVVKGVTDKSGSGNHLTADVGDGVQFRTGIKNGLSVVENFGAATEYLQVALNVGSPHAFVCVCRTPSAIDGGFGNSIISSITQPSNQTNIQLVTAATRYFSTQAAFVTSVLDPGGSDLDTWRIYVFDMDGADNPVYLENVFDVDNAAGALTRDGGFRLMHDDSLGGGSWDSYCAEVYMFDGAFSAATRTALVDSLKTKWDIA